MRGDYRGVASAGFVIRPAGVRIRSVSVSGSHLTVRWKARKRQTDGYQIRCTEKTASRRRQRTVTIDSNAVQRKTIRIHQGECGVQIRTYKKRNGKAYYSRWSSKKTLLIN